MATKIGAARVAARSGARTVIANGATVDVLAKLRAGAFDRHAAFSGRRGSAGTQTLDCGSAQDKGELELDAGAVEVLRHGGKSLLAVGVTAARGNFARGEVVLCLDPAGAAVAKGLVNYSSAETQKILGCATRDIEGRLGYVREPELMHRDNLVLL